MKAYKLFRLKKDGSITSLFINKSQPIPLNKWVKSKGYRTEGFFYRPGWHSTHQPKAPHLSNKGRIWAEIEIKDYKVLQKPKNQGGLWYLSKMMKVNRFV